MGSIIFDKVKQLCDENGITINKLESELGLGRYTITRWKNAASPSVQTVSLIANYFHVSIDYLVGKSDIRDTADTLISDPDSVTIQRARDRMDDHDKARMMAILKLGFEDAFSDEENKEMSGLLDK